MTKRIYAEFDMIPHDESAEKSFSWQSSIHNHGLIPHLSRPFQKLQIHTNNQIPINLEELKNKLEDVFQSFFDENFTPSKYREISQYFFAVAKSWNSLQLDEMINEVLKSASSVLIESIYNCETIVDLSNCWVTICKNFQKVKLLLCNLPQNEYVIDKLCSQCLPQLKEEDIQAIYDIIFQEFWQLDQNHLSHIRDFITKIGLYTEQFVQKIQSELLSFINEQHNQIAELPMTGQLTQLWDILPSLHSFSSCLLRGNDKAFFADKLNAAFSDYFFGNLLESQLSELIIQHNIDEIKRCIQISNKIGKSDQFLDLFEKRFNAYMKKILINSPKAEFFNNLLEICKKLNDYKDTLFVKPFMKKLTASFRKLMNQDQTWVSIQVAIGIDKIFRSESKPDVFLFFSLFKLLQMKDSFEAYHTNLLMKRIKRNNYEVLASDIILIDQIRSYCNNIYTTRFDSIIENADFSKKAFLAFQDEFEVPRCFKVYLYHSNIMPYQNNFECNLPSVMSIISDQYFAFLRDRFPNRKYEWSIQTTKAKLAYKTNIKTFFQVQCNGLFASLLLSFNNCPPNGKTIRALQKNTHMKPDTIRPMLEILIKKVHLIKQINDKYAINDSNESKKIKIPSIKDLDLIADQHEKNKEYITDNQIDCLVIRILKNQKTCPKDLLFEKIKEKIGSITPEKYTNRIDHLKKKFIIIEDDFQTLQYS